MNKRERARLRAIEIETQLILRAEKIFKEAWHEADRNGFQGQRTRRGLEALVNAGLLVDLSVFPLHVLDGLGSEEGGAR